MSAALVACDVSSHCIAVECIIDHDQQSLPKSASILWVEGTHLLLTVHSNRVSGVAYKGESLSYNANDLIHLGSNLYWLDLDGQFPVEVGSLKDQYLHNSSVPPSIGGFSSGGYFWTEYVSLDLARSNMRLSSRTLPLSL